MIAKGPPLEVAVIRNADGWPEELETLAETAVRAALAGAKARITGATEVTVVFTDDAEQQELNRTWRQIDKSTNVLSFPQLEPGADVSGLLGDITLARETVAREAAEQGVTLEDHACHLIVHGLLHLLGYDHLADDEALAMETLETQILAGLGIADPYGDD